MSRSNAKNHTLLPAVIFTLSLLFAPLFSALSQEYAIGADLSFLKSAEDRGFSFRENDSPKPGLDIFRDHGYNWIRLRLFWKLGGGIGLSKLESLRLKLRLRGGRERRGLRLELRD